VTQDDAIRCELCDKVLPGRRGLEFVWICTPCHKAVADPHLILDHHTHHTEGDF